MFDWVPYTLLDCSKFKLTSTLKVMSTICIFHQKKALKKIFKNDFISPPKKLFPFSRFFVIHFLQLLPFKVEVEKWNNSDAMMSCINKQMLFLITLKPL